MSFFKQFLGLAMNDDMKSRSFILLLTLYYYILNATNELRKLHLHNSTNNIVKVVRR